MKQDKARGSLHDATFSSTNRNGKQQDFIDPCSCTPFQVKSLPVKGRRLFNFRDHFLTKILHYCLTNCFFYDSFTFYNFYLDIYSFSFGLLFPFFCLDFYFPFQFWTSISLFYLNLNLPLPERIYNPITAMGFSAMFTFQVDNTKR